MKYLFLLLLCFSASAADRFVQITTNGTLVSPTDFFTVNSNLIVSAISGAFGTGSGSGDVVGPFSAPDGALVVFDGTTGKLIKSATVTESQILTESEASSFYAPLNSPAFTGTVTFDSGTFGTLTITTNLFVADVAYGAGWDTSTNVPTRNAVYDKIQSLLTLFQGTNANLTTLATLNGGSLTNLDGSKIASGQIPIARMATGTPDGTKFVRDDGTLATPAGSVTSVGATSTIAGLNFSGSPVTGAGTLSLTGVVGVASIDSAVATDSELSAHAALTNSHGVSTLGALLSAQTTSANFRTQLGLGSAALKTDTDFQATNAALTALAGNPSLYQSSNSTLTALSGLNGTGLTNVGGPSGYSSTPYRIVLVGDSLTAGTYGSTNGGYSGWLTNSTYGLLPANFVIVTNGGVSAKKLTTMAANFSTEIQPFAPSGGTNGLVIIWGGINDLSVGTNATTLFISWSNLVSSCKASGFEVLAMTVTASDSLTNEVERIEFNSRIRNSSLWDYFVDLSWVPAPFVKGFHYDHTHFYDRMHSRQAAMIAEALRRPKRTVIAIDRFDESVKSGSQSNYRGWAYSRIIRSDTYPLLAMEKPGGDIVTIGPVNSKFTAALQVGAGNISWPNSALFELDLAASTFFAPLKVVGNGGTSNTVAFFSVPTATKTANYSPTVLENNTWFNNNGASGAITNTLPAAFAGRQYGFVILAAQQLVIKAAGSDTIRILGTVSAGGGQAATNVVGTTIHLHCPVAGQWVADSQMGAWAVQ